MDVTLINTDNLRSCAPFLSAGDRVLLSGVVYTARDAAHKRISAALENGSELPFDLNGAVNYYTGPTPAKNGMAVGSAGPTTSGRMDVYTPALLDAGLCGMIGKGARNEQVTASIIKNGAVYFCAVGGAGALYCRHITSCEVIAYDDLGCESVKKLQVDKLPLVVGIDCRFGSLFTRTN